MLHSLTGQPLFPLYQLLLSESCPFFVFVSFSVSKSPILQNVPVHAKVDVS